jgi:hypothetical protein
MPSWLLIINSYGIPLFDRSYGLPAQPFAHKGLLSVVQSQAWDSGFSVRRLASKDSQIAYRTYEGGLVVVLTTSNIDLSEREVQKRIDRIYQAIAFTIGPQALIRMPTLTGRHPVENSKRQLLSAGDLLDTFLEEEDADALVETVCGLHLLSLALLLESILLLY